MDQPWSSWHVGIDGGAGSQALALRRLVIGETHRFPDLAAAYYERAPARVLAALAAELEGLGRRGLLKITDPQLAAEHFAFLTVGKPLDQGMFHTAEAITADQRERTQQTTRSGFSSLPAADPESSDHRAPGGRMIK